MMNLLAIGLLVSTLTAAGVWSPPANPSQYNHHHESGSDRVLHEKNRIIVMEYEREIPTGTGTTPTGTAQHEALPESTEDKKDFVESAKDKLSGMFHGAGSNIEGNVNSAKDEVSEAKDAATGKLSQAIESAENKLFRAKDKTEEKLSHAKESAENKLFQAKEAIKDKFSDSKEKTEEKLSRAKEKGEDKFSEAKEEFENKLSRGKEKIEGKLSEAKEASKDKLSDVYEDIKDKAYRLKEEMEETKGKTENIVDKTAKNLTDIAKRARDLAYDMAAYVANPKLGRAIWSVVHLLGFAMAYGTSIWVTFFSSQVLGSALPRQQFGIVQSRVYPVYFRTVAYGVGLAFLAQFFGRDREKIGEKLQGYNLLGALSMVLANSFFLEPMATKIMFERLKTEKEEGRGRDVSDQTPTRPKVTTTTATTTIDPAIGSFGTAKTTRETEVVDNEEERIAKNKIARLSGRLRMWNTYSSLLNVLVLMALTWHNVHLAGLMTCCD